MPPRCFTLDRDAPRRHTRVRDPVVDETGPDRGDTLPNGGDPGGFRSPDLDPPIRQHLPGGGATTITAIGHKKNPGGATATDLRPLPPGVFGKSGRGYCEGRGLWDVRRIV